MKDKIVKNNPSHITVGIVLSRMKNEWNRELAYGIKDAAFAEGISIIQYCMGCLNSRNTGSLQCNILSELINTDKLNALIISSTVFAGKISDKDCELFCRKFASVPVIVLNKELNTFYTVSHDVYQSVVIAVRHLVEVHQYYNIAFMQNSNAPNYQINISAFRNTLNSYNIAVNNKYIISEVPGDRQKDKLLAILLKLMENGAEVIVTGGIIAKNVIYVLANAGVKVPGEIAVMGITNIVDSQFTVPPLSTIDHSFYREGRAVIGKIKELLNGQSFGKNIKLEPILIRRSSCGCFNQPVHEITERISHENLTAREGLFSDNKNKIIPELIEMAGDALENRSFINELFNAYETEIKNPGGYIFLNFLNQFFKSNTIAPIKPNILHKVLSCLIKWSIPYLKYRENFFLMQYTWQQTRLFIDNLIMHNQALTVFHAKKNFKNYRILSRKLLSTVDMKKLLNLLAAELSGNKIPYVYTVIYENPKPYKYPDQAPKWSRLIMAYTEKGPIDLDETGLRFQTKKILPDKIWKENFKISDSNFYCIIESLNLEGRQIGYMIFGVSGQPSDISFWLKFTISISLHGALDYKQRQLQKKKQVIQI